jgi:AraC family transcriptional activator of pobA
MSVVSSPEKKDVPVYSLLQNSQAGHSMLEVVRAGGVAGSAQGAAQGAAAGVVYRDPGFLIPHRKDYYLLVFVIKGDSRHWVDFVPYTLQPGTFYFTTPHQVHLKEEMKPMEGIIVRFSYEFLQLEENRMLARLPVILNPADGHVLQLTGRDILYSEELLWRMLAEFNGKGPWRNHMLAALLQELLIYLSRLYQEQYGNMSQAGSDPLQVGAGAPAPPARSVLRELQSLINLHYRKKHDVTSYAVLLNLTPDYLNDLIKQQSGKTVLTHIHHRLMVEAKRLLLHTEYSIKEIAGQLGFADAAYFNRFFRRMADATPVQYRVQIREMYR